MSALKNSRHEIFVRNWFGGKTQEGSAIAAGYKPSRARQTSSWLVTNSNIIARYNELQEQAASKEVADFQERQKILSEIARANLTDFVDEEGSVTLKAPNNKALQEVSIENWKGGKDGRATSQTKKVKLHNPVPAIDLLNKMDRIYTEGGNTYNDIKVLIVREKPKEIEYGQERTDEAQGTALQGEEE